MLEQPQFPLIAQDSRTVFVLQFVNHSQKDASAALTKDLKLRLLH